MWPSPKDQFLRPPTPLSHRRRPLGNSVSTGDSATNPPPHPIYPIPIPPEKLERALDLFTRYKFASALADGPASTEDGHPQIHIPSRTNTLTAPNAHWAGSSLNVELADLDSVVSFDALMSMPSPSHVPNSQPSLTVSAKQLKVRKRKPLSCIAKAKAELIRFLGACSACHSRKVPCPFDHHDIALLERLFEENPPKNIRISPLANSEKEAKEQGLADSDYLSHSLIGLGKGREIPADLKYSEGISLDPGSPIDSNTVLTWKESPTSWSYRAQAPEDQRTEISGDVKDSEGAFLDPWVLINDISSHTVLDPPPTSCTYNNLLLEADLSQQAWRDTPSTDLESNAQPLDEGIPSLASLWSESVVKPSDLQATISEEIMPMEHDDYDSTSLCAELVEPWMEVLEERISWALTDDPHFSACILKHLKPHYETLACLFDNDEALALFRNKLYGVRQHAQGQSKSTPTSSSPGSSQYSTQQNNKPTNPQKRSGDDAQDDERDPKRNKSDPSPDPPPRPKPRKRLRFKCHFCAKDCLRHCKKDDRVFKSSGFSKINDITSTHWKEYHWVIRCGRCLQKFDKISDKNEHLSACNISKQVPIDDMIDCIMKAKLAERMKGFRTWAFRNEKNADMQRWIASNIEAFSGIPLPDPGRVIFWELWPQVVVTWQSILVLHPKDLRQLFPIDELDGLLECLRELGKWYAIWETLFPGVEFPSHPFHDTMVAIVSHDENSTKAFQVLFRGVVEAKADREGLPPSDFALQAQWYQDCIALALELIGKPANSNPAMSCTTALTPRSSSRAESQPQRLDDNEIINDNETLNDNGRLNVGIPDIGDWVCQVCFGAKRMLVGPNEGDKCPLCYP